MRVNLRAFTFIFFRSIRCFRCLGAFGVFTSIKKTSWKQQSWILHKCQYTLLHLYFVLTWICFTCFALIFQNLFTKKKNWILVVMINKACRYHAIIWGVYLIHIISKLTVQLSCVSGMEERATKGCNFWLILLIELCKTREKHY